MKIVFLLLFYVLNMALAYKDAELNEDGKGILLGNHLISFITRYIIAFLLILTSYGWGDILETKEPLGWFLVYGGGAWILFDLTYNWGRGLELDYVGSTSWLDKIFKIFGKWDFAVQIAVKLIMLFIGIYMVVS